MQYTDYELNNLHRILIEILQEIIRICEKYSIKWFSVGGTTLGAIRHKGFIPWDDDIDIGMMRNDYELFLKIAPHELKQDYALQHFYVDENTPTYFAKVRKNNTEFREAVYSHLNINHGIFVDIMPFDFVPDNKVERNIYFYKTQVLQNFYISKVIQTSTDNFDSYKTFHKRIIRLFSYYFLKNISRSNLYHVLDRFLRKFNENKTQTISTRADFSLQCKYSDVFPVKKMPFEGMEINVPNNYKEVLCHQYGNYMKLPAVENRINHKPKVLRFE